MLPFFKGHSKIEPSSVNAPTQPDGSLEVESVGSPTTTNCNKNDNSDDNNMLNPKNNCDNNSNSKPNSKTNSRFAANRLTNNNGISTASTAKTPKESSGLLKKIMGSSLIPPLESPLYPPPRNSALLISQGIVSSSPSASASISSSSSAHLQPSSSSSSLSSTPSIPTATQSSPPPSYGNGGIANAALGSETYMVPNSPVENRAQANVNGVTFNTNSFNTSTNPSAKVPRTSQEFQIPETPPISKIVPKDDIQLDDWTFFYEFSRLSKKTDAVIYATPRKEAFVQSHHTARTTQSKRMIELWTMSALKSLLNGQLLFSPIKNSSKETVNGKECKGRIDNVILDIQGLFGQEWSWQVALDNPESIVYGFSPRKSLINAESKEEKLKKQAQDKDLACRNEASSVTKDYKSHTPSHTLPKPDVANKGLKSKTASDTVKDKDNKTGESSEHLEAPLSPRSAPSLTKQIGFGCDSKSDPLVGKTNETSFDSSIRSAKTNSEASTASSQLPKNLSVGPKSSAPNSRIPDSSPPEYPFYPVDTINIHPLEPLSQSHPGPPNYIPCTGESLLNTPFPSNSFDVISTNSLWYTITKDEWLPAMEEMWRILKPGGYIELLVCDFEVLGINNKVSSANTINSTNEPNEPSESNNDTNNTFDALTYFREIPGAQWWSPLFETAISLNLDLAPSARTPKLLYDAGFENVASAPMALPHGWGGPVGHMTEMLLLCSAEALLRMLSGKSAEEVDNLRKEMRTNSQGEDSTKGSDSSSTDAENSTFHPASRMMFVYAQKPKL